MDDEIRPTIEALAAEHGVARAMLVAPGMLDDELPDLMAAGSFQRGNAMLALGAAAALVGEGFKVRPAMEAIAKVVVPGRLEVVGRYPLVIRDAAHNPDGARALAGELARATRGAKPVVGVIALLADKDADGFVAALAGSFDVVIATATDSERALPAKDLMAACAAHGLEVEVVPDPEAALTRARFRTGSAGAVVIAGSLTLLAALDN
jgi:dihydrofolate synthase/folylpolyglutamate synthase